jgi:hypothetical protein
MCAVCCALPCGVSRARLCTGLAGAPPAANDAVPPPLPLPRTDPSKPRVQPSLKAIFDKHGPAAFAKAVRDHKCVRVRRACAAERLGTARGGAYALKCACVFVCTCV